MSWKAYRLVYQAKSPLHIGWSTLGYIKLTRYYILGKNMWGAITSNLVRTYYKYEDYTGVGNMLCSNMLNSYFYPALDPEIPLLPRFTDEGLKYGIYTKSEFEKLFIKSYGQTAVLPSSNTAEDGSLHESEFISSIVEHEMTNEQDPVYFIGYIFLRDDIKYDGHTIEWEQIEEAIRELSIGGDRKYGWGGLKLINQPGKDGEKSDMFGFDLTLSEQSLFVTIQGKAGIPAHLKITDNIELIGNIEPLVGREWGDDRNTNIGPGRKISAAKVCWMPGSILANKQTLKIRSFGILAAHSEI